MQRTHLGDVDLRPVRPHGRLVSVRFVKGTYGLRTTRSYTLCNLRVTVEELSKPEVSHQHKTRSSSSAQMTTIVKKNDAKPHLERLKEMLARGVASALVHHFVWRKVGKLVIRLVFVVEQDPWTCMRISPSSRGNDDVGVSGIPALCTRCEEGLSQTHCVSGSGQSEEECLGKRFGEVEVARRGVTLCGHTEAF